MQEGFSKPPWPPFPRQVVDWFLPPTTLRRVLAHDPHPSTWALRTRPRGPPCRELCALSTACPFYGKFSSCFKKACKFRAFCFIFLSLLQRWQITQRIYGPSIESNLKVQHGIAIAFIPHVGEVLACNNLVALLHPQAPVISVRAQEIVIVFDYYQVAVIMYSTTCIHDAARCTRAHGLSESAADVDTFARRILCRIGIQQGAFGGPTPLNRRRGGTHRRDRRRCASDGRRWRQRRGRAYHRCGRWRVIRRRGVSAATAHWRRDTQHLPFVYRVRRFERIPFGDVAIVPAVTEADCIECLAALHAVLTETAAGSQAHQQ